MAPPAYLLIWNPRLWPWRDFARQSARLRGKDLRGGWSSGTRQNLEPGSRFYLMRVGPDPRGIIGAGHTTHEPKLRTHWDPLRARRGEKTWFVGTHFEALVGTPLLDLHTLQDAPISFNWTPRASGIQIPATLATWVERKWRRALTHDNDREQRSLQGFPEGGRRKVTVNAYERDRRNRALCIAHHGATCYTCGMDFESTYGPEAAGFIHVHHVTPPRGRIVRPNPIRDMVPLCPNCHAVVHLVEPPMRPNRLRSKLRGRA